jgi:deoxyribodipyrimidine photo-lyase
MLVQDELIHRPWEADKVVLADAGVTLGKEYPLPIVDHAERREQALEMYGEVKSRAPVVRARATRAARAGR